MLSKCPDLRYHGVPGTYLGAQFCADEFVEFGFQLGKVGQHTCIVQVQWASQQTKSNRADSDPSRALCKNGWVVASQTTGTERARKGQARQRWAAIARRGMLVEGDYVSGGIAEAGGDLGGVGADELDDLASVG